MRYPVVFLFLFTEACGAVSPEYGIGYAGGGPRAGTELDTAWRLGVTYAGGDPKALSTKTYVSVTISDAPIEFPGLAGKAHGTDYNEPGAAFVQVQQIGPSLLDADTPLVHEFAHVARYLMTGDPDYGHTLWFWHVVDEDFSAEGESKCATR